MDNLEIPVGTSRELADMLLQEYLNGMAERVRSLTARVALLEQRVSPLVQDTGSPFPPIDTVPIFTSAQPKCP